MTKKRRYLIPAAIFVACICVVLGVLAMMPPGPGVTKANFDRIEVGMTLDEVQAILGECHWMEPPNRMKKQGGLGVWLGAGDREAIIVGFNGDNLSTVKEFRPSTETLTDKLRRWLHLPE